MRATGAGIALLTAAILAASCSNGGSSSGSSADAGTDAEFPTYVPIPGWPDELTWATIPNCDTPGPSPSVRANLLMTSWFGSEIPASEPFIVYWSICNGGDSPSQPFDYQLLISERATPDDVLIGSIDFHVPAMDSCKCDAFYQTPSFAEFNNDQNPANMRVGPGVIEFDLSPPFPENVGTQILVGQ